MTNKSLTIGLVVTFVIAVLGIFSPVGQSAINGLGTALANCADGVTCFTKLGVTETFEVDGTATLNSTLAVTGDITTQAQFGVGTTSPTQIDISALSSATTTLGLFSSGTLKGGCIQLEGTDGTLYRVYATTTATRSPLYYELGSCK